MIHTYPHRRPQRRPHPARLAPRLAVNGQHLARLAGRLTARDRWLARMVHEHKVLTVHQIVQAAWPSRRAANDRLIELYHWRVLDRFQPLTASGSAPMHYVLDIAGAHVLAAEDGKDPRQLAYRHPAAIGIAHSLLLAHTTGTNGLFTTLIARSRQPHALERLTAWWSETRCGRHFGDIVRPDAYGRLHHQHIGTVEWFLEYDRGTEPLNKLASKLDRYQQLARTTSVTTPVLFWLPSTRREAGARTALTAAHQRLADPTLVPVATTSPGAAPDQPTDPAAARWLPLPDTRTGGRLPLAELTRAWPHLPAVSPSATTADTETPPTALNPPPPMPPNH